MNFEIIIFTPIFAVLIGSIVFTTLKKRKRSAKSIYKLIDDLEKKYNPLDFIFVESGGDNLASSFSPELVDLSIYVIDVSAGDKIPRKGGPGITRSDLLLINKIDLADKVGADLNIMKSDTEFMRKGKPWFFTNLSSGTGVEEITQFLESHIPNNRN